MKKLDLNSKSIVYVYPVLNSKFNVFLCFLQNLQKKNIFLQFMYSRLIFFACLCPFALRAHFVLHLRSGRSSFFFTSVFVFFAPTHSQVRDSVRSKFLLSQFRVFLLLFCWIGLSIRTHRHWLSANTDWCFLYWNGFIILDDDTICFRLKDWPFSFEFLFTHLF